MAEAPVLLQSGSPVLLQSGYSLLLQGSESDATPVLFGKELESYLYEKLNVDIWPNTLPKNARLPSLVYTLISAVRPKRLGSASTKVIWTCQFDAYSFSSWEAEEVTENLRLTLEGFRGMMGSVSVAYASPQDGLTKYEDLKGGEDEQGIQRMMSEYKIYVYVRPVMRG